ncbi:hypothetical protein WN943_001476 [Citrus x changshan-huyou]
MSGHRLAPETNLQFYLISASRLSELSDRRLAPETNLQSCSISVQSCSYDRKLRAKTQSLKDELEQEKRQSSKLSAAIEKLEEKVALSKSVSHLEHELSSVKDELINARKDLEQYLENKESGETDPPSRTTIDAAPPQVTADSALSVVKKSHGAEVDPPTKAP